MRRVRGYILVEAVTAMALLCIGTVAIQGALRQAVITRGQARDYTQARFLLDQLIAETELQPMLVEEQQEGAFPGDLSRFRYRVEVKRVDLTQPETPPDMDSKLAGKAKLQVKYLTKITATVYWERAGDAYEETFETLWLADKLYSPEENV